MTSNAQRADEYEIQGFWNEHPCGQSQVGPVLADYEQFFARYDAPEGPPAALGAIADVVLNYRPKSKQPKPRKRKKTKRVKRG